MSERRLEIGCGPSPRPGYEHNDVTPAPGVHLDHVGAAHNLCFPDETFVEVFGTGFFEHLTYEQVAKFLRKAIRWLTPGGVLVLDAPDTERWLVNMIKQDRSRSSVITAFNGWCRWPGDEHKSWWTADLMLAALYAVGFSPGTISVKRGSDREDGLSTNDWHLCVRAVRPDVVPEVIDRNACNDGWGSDGESTP